MNYKSKITDDSSTKDADDEFAAAMLNKYAIMTPEDFLERARNADRILENCRKSMRGV
jgi:hypothetical protein